MADEPLWECTPRTRAKLEIIRNYLGAWFGILANRGFPHVVYVDGFCGPGAYTTGEDGSPVIAAYLANETVIRNPGFRATLFFVDLDLEGLEHLRSTAAVKEHHPNVTIEIKHGVFVENIAEIIDYLRIHTSSPTFSFIDPFGFGHSPFKALKQLMHNDHSELFINFMCGFMNRFKEHENEEITAKIKSMVGVNDLRPIKNADDSTDAFCDAFESRLLTLGPFVRKFMMRDETNGRDNAFFFCGRNVRGFVKMKEAMWKVDPEHGASFSHHREATNVSAQGNIFELSSQTIRLSKFLVERFQAQTDVPVSEIFKWVDEHTTFLSSRARVELEALLERGRITYVDPNPTGRKRAYRNWPPRLLISFRE